MSSFLAKKSMLDADMREYAQRDRGAGDVQEGLGWRILLVVVTHPQIQMGLCSCRFFAGFIQSWRSPLCSQ